jgi:hypothetical protein
VDETMARRDKEAEAVGVEASRGSEMYHSASPPYNPSIVTPRWEEDDE